jgi:hypothetical protein
MARNIVCSECGGKMEMGIIVDRANLYAAIDASYWMKGINERSWFGLKIYAKEKHYISALRCETCGFLKLYAGPDLSESN